MNDTRISLKYILIGIVAVIATWIIHELAHWLTSQSLGYDTVMSLNGTFPKKGQIPTSIHQTLISASGPIVTVLQGFVVFLLLKNRPWNKLLYPFLFTAFYMRFVAGVMNLISLNDEGRISNFLGIGTFALPLLVSGVLFFMVFKISRQHQLGWKFQLATTLLVMVSSSILILGDQYFGVRYWGD